MAAAVLHGLKKKSFYLGSSVFQTEVVGREFPLGRWLEVCFTNGHHYPRKAIGVGKAVKVGVLE